MDESFLMNYLYFVFIASVVGYKTEIQEYNAPVVKQPIGECVTLTAIVNYEYYKGTKTIRWTKDQKKLISNERETVNGKSVSITSLRSSDFAFYQVVVEGFHRDDSTLKIVETTNFWINVIGCSKNQKENKPSSATACEKLCEDTCPIGWTYVPGSKGKCMKYISTPTAWLMADEACQDDGAVLATIATPSENWFLASMLQTGNGGWIGLNDRIEESKYVWNFNSQNTPSFWTWGKGEPNNYNRDCNIENCIVIKKGNGRWNDIICGAFNSFVCEVDRHSYNGTDTSSWSCTGHKCYKFYHTYMIWHDALLSCKSKHPSGKLATIYTQGENNLVASLILGNLQHTAWIGLNDIWEAGLYSWNEFKGIAIEASFLNWDIGEPNDKFTRPFAEKCLGEDCIQLKSSSGNATWQDLSCDTKIPYICEKVRERTYSTGGIVGILIGAVISFAMVVGFIYVTYLNRKRTAVKDIMKDSYADDMASQKMNDKKHHM